MTRLYDAHNHLQDPRFPKDIEVLVAEAADQGVQRMVVNGCRESDWGDVLALARRFPAVLPSFGCHPWYVEERSQDWETRLIWYLDQVPSAVGEIGLDRWKCEQTLEVQKEVFNRTLRLAAARDLPVSIHCLKAWGCLYDLLRSQPLPRRGFMLHSYGGPEEMVKPLAGLGAYFSFPGDFAHDRRSRQRHAFLEVPRDRLLIETDAPDQLPPLSLTGFPLVEAATGKALNHPANLRAVYQFAARMWGEEEDLFAARVEVNFLRLFGGYQTSQASVEPCETSALAGPRK